MRVLRKKEDLVVMKQAPGKDRNSRKRGALLPTGKESVVGETSKEAVHGEIVSSQKKEVRSSAGGSRADARQGTSQKEDVELSAGRFSLCTDAEKRES